MEKADYLEIRTRIVNEYLYSYGGLSPFFRALLEDEELLGTRCPSCGKGYCPPRTNCGQCYAETEWIKLSGEGTVLSSVDCYYVPANYELLDRIDLPYTLALIRLDGADTALYSVVHTGDPRANLVKPGARVRAVFREQREGRLTDVYFVLEEGEGQ